MNEFEDSTLVEATHVQVNGVIYQIAGNISHSYFHDHCVGLYWEKEDAFIPRELFNTLGIYPLKEKKLGSIEFEAVFVKNNGQWYPLHSLNETLTGQDDNVAKFKCVQILN